MAVALEVGIEWVRPLVNSQPWEYCVIWKLGNDPSRFIEWGACCCSSGTGTRARGVGIKMKGDECKDRLIKHPITSIACKRLSQLPSAIPLYSGVHGDVVISTRPRWTTDDELNGTQVLIPVTWGLIELYTTKRVARDEKMIEYISARFLKRESMMYCPSSFHQPTNYSSFEGSSTCSSLSNEHQLLHHQICKDYVDSPARNPRLRRNLAFTNGNEKTRQRTEKGPFKSKNLMTERNRRKRIKDRELALRSLVPKISKMDKVGTLVDAADYIKELLGSIRNYRDELEALEEEDCNQVNAAAERPVLVRDSEKTAIVVGVEVNQLGTKDFLVKIMSKQRQGAFSRLMEALDCLGLEVADANVTTLHGLVSNVLKVEAMRADFDPNTLKHSLVELIN